MRKEAGKTDQKRRLLRLLAGTLLTVCGIVCCVGCGLLGYIICSTPALQLQDVTPEGYRSVVLDEAGEVMLELAGPESNRVYVTVEEMPRHLKNAFIAIEDERFYTHPGVDLRGIARALYRNVVGGRVSQGASTITQQLIKNNVFTDTWMEEETLWDKGKRKIQEQILALRLEKMAEKDWILENYLNSINLGAGAWGVQAAADRYFAKEVSQLTLSESAVLAAIAKSPTGYNPITHPEENRQRRDLVLEKMLRLGHIEEEEYLQALEEEVYLSIGEHAETGAGDAFSYFEDAMLLSLVADLRNTLGYSEEEAWNLIYRGGLTIHATQNTPLQTHCEAVAADESLFSGDEQISIVVTDPATGAVRAMIGGRGEKTASLTFNRAVSAVRQPGSTIKVVGEYAAAIDTGEATLGAVYDDAPYAYSNGTPIRNASGTFSGRMTVRQAIIASINTVALKCFQQTGMDLVWSYLQDFGFAHLTAADRVEALALGGTSGGVTNLELTAAYAAIAGGGTYIEPYYYTAVYDRSGNLLLNKEPHSRPVIQPSTAQLLTDAMTGVLKTGSGALAAFDGVALAGKTGTTTDMRDTWFVGYSPAYACGVWGGHDDYSVQRSSAYVKKIWRSVMEKAHSGQSHAAAFPLNAQLVRCTICEKCGQLAVDGLCDSTVQGDATYEEWFLSGTEPTQLCSCHISVTLCAVTGLPAAAFCPSSGLKHGVYLISGSAGTADETAVYIPTAEQSCTVHRYWWNTFLPGYDPHAEGIYTPASPVPTVPTPSGPVYSTDVNAWLNWMQGNP